MTRNLLYPLAVCLLAAAPNADAAPAAGLIAIGELQEHFQANVKIAGAVLVGFQYRGSGRPLDINRLAVDLPENAKGMLCLELSTRDGRYTATQDFRLEGARPGPAMLDLHSHEAQSLRSYAEKDLAVKVVLRDDCDEGGPGTVVAGRWAQSPNDSPLDVFLNIKLSQATAQLIDTRRAPQVGGGAPCAPITAGARTTYDHVCSLSIAPEVVDSAHRLRLTITGTTGSRRTEDIAVALAP